MLFFFHAFGVSTALQGHGEKNFVAFTLISLNKQGLTR